MQRKLARCQWSSGRISLISQVNSAGSRNRRDPRCCVTEDNVRPPECRRDQTLSVEPRDAHLICPENPCDVRFSINSRRFPRKRVQSPGKLCWRSVRKTIRKSGVFVFANGGFLVGLRKPPRNRNDFSDHLRILVISKLCGAMEIPRIRMEDEFVVFDSATCCYVHPIALDNNID